MRTLYIIGLALALSACAPSQRPADEAVPLSGVATRIKTELINAQSLDAAAIQVEARDGVIYLHGFADSEAKKRQLESVAEQAAGGHRVVSRIEIK